MVNRQLKEGPSPAQSGAPLSLRAPTPDAVAQLSWLRCPLSGTVKKESMAGLHSENSTLVYGPWLQSIQPNSLGGELQ